MRWFSRRLGIGVFVGRDYARLLDCQFFIGLGLNETTDPGLIPWRRYLDVAWNWRPTIQRVHWPGSWFFDPDIIDSSAWTGRHSEIVGWSWPFVFHIGRVGG